MNQNSAISPRSSNSIKKSFQRSIKSTKSKRSSKLDLKKKESNSETSKTSCLYSNEDNDKLIIVAEIKQEIIEKALEEIYEKYLDKQTVFFVSHCSHLAWKSLIEWNYQKMDKGGFKELATRKYLDIEPKTSTKDSWAGNSIPIRQNHEKDPLSMMDSTSFTVSELITEEDYKKAAEELTNLSMAAQTPMAPVKQPSFKLQFKQDKRFQSQRKKSEEPLLSTPAQVKGNDHKNDSYELPPPAPLQGKYFPSSRVEVKYNISPVTRGQATNKEPKVKTIRLKRNIEKKLDQ